MALCTVCLHPKVKEINRALLRGVGLSDASLHFELPRWRLKDHRRKHLPFRSPKLGEAVTVADQMRDLKLELRRLQVLAECGEDVRGALSVIRQRQSLLELEARMDGQLDATHMKLIKRNREPDGDFEVKFIDGKAVTVPVPVSEP